MNTRVASVVFKKEYETRLMRAGLKRKFVANLIAYHGRMNLPMVADTLNRQEDWYSFIACAFLWETSVEGNGYWYDVANMRALKIAK